MIQLLPQFLRVDGENHYLHLKEFEAICETFQEPNCNMDVVRLNLFPFSFKEKAKLWIYDLRTRFMSIWLEMKTKFFNQYFPFQCTVTLRRKITLFKQNENESFYEGWERYHGLINFCPHHGYELWRVVSLFYGGLITQSRQFVETMCNREFMSKEPKEAYAFLEQLARSSHDSYKAKESLARGK